MLSNKMFFIFTFLILFSSGILFQIDLNKIAISFLGCFFIIISGLFFSYLSPDKYTSKYQNYFNKNKLTIILASLFTVLSGIAFEINLNNIAVCFLACLAVIIGFCFFSYLSTNKHENINY